MRNEQDVISEKFNELRSLISNYARQEIRDPLTALVKWLSLGLLGMLFLLVGILFAALGLLRLLQNELTLFDSTLSFLPYILVFATLLILIAVSIKALRRHA
ncbi:MAG: hypothetical protein CL431_09270 [Acidimicrobiaceae bacterium]|jgi:uncharacterized membrane protein YidH (DUF202 family)|nr:hypothetical protein [Acidimicrobiaceae bacterium]|tara:strand:+ start:45882 stop:46187 length:306 start_codon:yes stop_codon:yes gene_type:complete